MKKAISLLLTLVLAAGSFALPTFAAEDKIQVTEDISVSADYDWTRFKGRGCSLNVYNWAFIFRTDRTKAWMLFRL